MHFKFLYGFTPLAVLMLQFMNFRLQLYFMVAFRLLQPSLQFLHLFVKGKLPEGHKILQLFGQPFLVDFFQLLFQQQFIIFESLNLPIEDCLSLLELPHFGIPLLQISPQLLQLLTQTCYLRLELLLLLYTGLQVVLFLIAQITLQSHYLIFQQHQLAGLQLQFFLQLQGTLPTASASLSYIVLSFVTRFQVGAFSGTIRACRSIPVLALGRSVRDPQKEVLGLDGGCRPFGCFGGLLGKALQLSRGDIRRPMRSQVSAVLIGTILLTGKALAHCRIGERLIDGRVCEDGEVENAGRGLFFTGVEQHRVNYNNKMNLPIITELGQKGGKGVTQMKDCGGGS